MILNVNSTTELFKRKNNFFHGLLRNQTMRILFFLIHLVIFINANSQIADSLGNSGFLHEINDSNNFKLRGKDLPDFIVYDLNGKVYSKDSLRFKKATFINLWFAACLPCIEEIPDLNRLYDSIKNCQDFQFFSITMESPSRVKEMIRQYDIHYPVFYTTHKILDQLSFTGYYPTNLVLNSKGKVQVILVGEPIASKPKNQEYFRQIIEKLLHTSCW